MKVMKIAQTPATTVGLDTTVFEAVKVMEQANSGAAVVVADGCLVGVVSERDVMVRVVGQRRDPATTRVRDVMTSTVKTVTPDSETVEALSVMVTNRIRHVVVADDRGHVLGLVHLRNVFPAHVESVEDQLRTLEAYVETDCPGG